MTWSQFQTVLWLRWRLSRNQWSRGGAVNAVITTIAALIGLGIGLSGLIAGVTAGVTVLSRAEPDVLLIVWDFVFGVFLFVWLLGLLAEIQRSESIDLSRLLHLPVTLQWIFVANYLISHLTWSVILFVPGMFGLCAGLVLGRGWEMLFLLPLVAALLFAVTAWTYCLRGWLVALMVNPRRRRAVMTGAVLALVLVGQAPNLYFNVIRRSARQQAGKNVADQNKNGSTSPTKPAKHISQEFLAAHQYVPALWIGGSAQALAQQRFWPALWQSLAAFGLGALGLARAYRSTIRFYRGDAKRIAAPKSTATQISNQPSKRESFLERRLPGVPEPVAALSLAFLRSMMRAPEVKFALVMNFVLFAIFGSMLISKNRQGFPEMAQPFLPAGVIGFTFFGMLQLMFNQFGFDRDGFRALLLLPVRRSHILLAKNLAFAPWAFSIGLIFLAMLTWITRLPLMLFVTGVLQLTIMFLVVSIAGNFVSVIAPYRIEPGSLKPTKAGSATQFLIFLSHLLFPLTMIPMAIPPLLGLLAGRFGTWTGILANVVGSIILLAIAAFLYRWSLEVLGRLLERREKQILQVITREVE